MILNDRTACSLKVTELLGDVVIVLTMLVFVDEVERAALAVHFGIEGRVEH